MRWLVKYVEVERRDERGEGTGEIEIEAGWEPYAFDRIDYRRTGIWLVREVEDDERCLKVIDGKPCGALWSECQTSCGSDCGFAGGETEQS